MLRSFLARPRPMLSHLGRHDCRFVAQLGRRADHLISRSYTSSEDETDSDVDLPKAKSVAANHMRQHLYLVLDDWRKGFSIHKLDLDDSSDGDDLTVRVPVHRQATGNRCWNFAAVGSKIVATGRVIQSNKDDYVTLVYDTEAAGLSIVPRLPEPLHNGWDFAMAARNRLYMFEGSSYLNGKYNGGMHILEDVPAPADDKYSRAFWWGTADHWSWSSIPTPPPFPICAMESIAVHPEGGGHTLFASIGEWSSVVDIDGNMILGDDQGPVVNREITDKGLMRTSQTFSCDTGTGEWRRHGNWDLPFYGQAHYDVELDAWVGLRKVYEQHNQWTDGYLCSCDVASPDGSPVEPAWKLCKEGLFEPYKPDTDARLLYMGSSNYCLVEVMSCGRFRSRRCANVGIKCVIRVATFRLKYGKKGELIVTGRRPNRSYHFSSFNETSTCSTSKVHAFWM